MRFIALILAVFIAADLVAEQAHAVELGTPLPLSDAAQAAHFEKMDGSSAQLGDYKGKVVLLNFWATWCGPCRREMPSIGRLQSIFEDRPLVVLAVAVDRAAPEKLAKFMEETEATNLQILRDPGMTSMKNFALRGLPSTIVLDADGMQVARHDGFDLWDRLEIVEALAALLPDA